SQRSWSTSWRRWATACGRPCCASCCASTSTASDRQRARGSRLVGDPSATHRIDGRVGTMVEMELVGVRVELPSNTPIVLLRETAGQRRVLPIFIGGPEATAIAFALDGVVTPRPMTHDLMKDLLNEVNEIGRAHV